MSSPISAFAPAFRICLCILALVLPNSSFASKIALVIGNSAYEHTTPLANPRNDAEAIASKLRLLGFETVEGYDLNMQEMSMKIRDFARASRGAEISVVFYAGHGMALNGENYLLPVDAVMQDETALDWELIPLSMITNQFNTDNGAHLLLLDACRDNPLAGKLAVATGNGTRSASSGGMAMVDVPNKGYGTGIAFATSPGAVASDGKGKHSPFTEALLTHIGTVNRPISSIMNSVKADVQGATDKVQVPWFQSSFTSDIYLNYREEPVAAPAPAPVADSAAGQTQQVVVQGAVSDDEMTYWTFANDSKDKDAYQLYLDLYPNGRFAPMARLAMEKLNAAQPQLAALAPTPQAPAAGGYAPTQTRSFQLSTLNTPLSLVPNAYMRALPANQQTETLLQIGDRRSGSQNKVVQARLTAAGYDVGAIDGDIGPGTRGKIRAWQAANGLSTSGYFNMMQLQLLVSQSEHAYADILNRSNVVRQSSGGGSNKKNKKGTGQGVGNAVNSFFHGLGTGMGLRSR